MGYWSTGEPRGDGVFAAEPISNVIGGTATFSTMLVTVYFRLPKNDGEPARL